MADGVSKWYHTFWTRYINNLHCVGWKPLVPFFQRVRLPRLRKCGSDTNRPSTVTLAVHACGWGLNILPPITAQLFTDWGCKLHGIRSTCIVNITVDINNHMVKSNRQAIKFIVTYTTAFLCHVVTRLQGEAQKYKLPIRTSGGMPNWHALWIMHMCSAGQ